MNPQDLEKSLANALGEVKHLEHLDGGGQGLVWRFDSDGQTFVVKVLNAGADPVRVEREISALSSADSPHVMKYAGTFDLSHDGHTLTAIKGEYIPGGTIASKLVDEPHPGTIDILRCAKGILIGLEEIHNHGRVHRDIKPQNIALRDGSWSSPVVLDLGLTRDLDDSITIYPELIGTLPFMAPEQIRLERAVKRTDVFGLGAVLFLLAADFPPFLDPEADQGIATEELRRRMAERTERLGWPRWSIVQDHLDENIAEFVARLISKEAYERPTVDMALAECEELLLVRGTS